VSPDLRRTGAACVFDLVFRAARLWRWKYSRGVLQRSDSWSAQAKAASFY
jgi:hypothetical protein